MDPDKRMDFLIGSFLYATPLNLTTVNDTFACVRVAEFLGDSINLDLGLDNVTIKIADIIKAEFS